MPKVNSRGLDHSGKDFFMWFFMWFPKNMWLFFKYTGWFCLFLTLLDHTKAIGTLNAQEKGILNDCTFCGKLFKTTSLQNHKRNHTKCLFWTEVRPPTLNFWYFFWFRMVPYGPNINVPGFPKFLSWKMAFQQYSSVHQACRLVGGKDWV